MNRSQKIFEEIENKLVKDDYASTLPVYHPAKGRRKRIVKEPETAYLGKGLITNSEDPPHSTIGRTVSQEEYPPSPPEIEDPNEEEFDPGRDLPGPEIDFPDEEEITEEEPFPEIEDPDEEEFGK
jgi:hypothetical protein